LRYVLAKELTLISRIFFTCVVAVVIGQRLIELKISNHNVATLLSQGGKQYPSEYHKLAINLQILWFIAMLGEVWILQRPFSLHLASIALLAALLGQFLRYLSMQALGLRWTLPVVTLPDAPIIKSGIYGYLRHPNWLGVVLEIPAVPLIHSAYLTAIVFSISNALLMVQRIQAEENALQNNCNKTNILAT
jgi:methyltransferase